MNETNRKDTDFFRHGIKKMPDAKGIRADVSPPRGAHERVGRGCRQEVMRERRVIIPLSVRLYLDEIQREFPRDFFFVCLYKIWDVLQIRKKGTGLGSL